MIQLLVKVCSLDNYPITTSKAYKKLYKLDPIAAKETIYIVWVPRDTG